MTRDEAIKILKDKIWPTFGSNEAASVWLDAFVELGMLKLEEPKSARENFEQLMRNVKLTQPQIEGLLHGMRMTGLTVIVEK